MASMEILGCSEPWFYGTLGSLDSIGTFGSSDSSDSACTLGSLENPPTAMSGVLARFPLLLPVRNPFASYGASGPGTEDMWQK